MVRYSDMDLYKEADIVLEDSCIEAILCKFGEVSIGGSYVYRTMVDRDIDFDVVLPAGAELSLELRSKIAGVLTSIGQLRGLQMSDIHNFPEGAKHAIDGIWFGLTLISCVSAERWNIDIWFVTPGSATEQDKDLTMRLHKLSDHERATIIALKQAALNFSMKKKGIASVKIYDAVLRKGVETYEEFLDTL